MKRKLNFLILLMILTRFSIPSSSGGIMQAYTNNGDIYLDGIPHQEQQAENIYSIGDACSDDALDLIGCSSYNGMGGSINDVTVLLIDNAIPAQFWEDGETKGWFDIIQYRVTYENPNVVDVVKGNVGPETWSDLDDTVLAYEVDKDHGITVLSALSIVARGIKVVFVTSPTIHNDNINHIWKAVDEAIKTPGIDVDIISFSGSDYVSASEYEPGNTYFEDWEERGIFMITSAGNEGEKDNYGPDKDDIMRYHKYPQFESQWYSIGSIDFENRADDPGNEYEAGSTTGNTSPWSSWGDEWEENSANSVDFVMPGNGVPVYSYNSGGHVDPEDDYFWAYDAGTSLSTPYMAGAVAVLIDTYMDMRDEYGGDRIKPSISTIYSVLKESSSLSTPDEKLGWGYVNLINIYGNVYTLDTDSDGIFDGHEYLAGTNPLVDEQAPTISITLTGGVYYSGSVTVGTSAYDAWGSPTVTIYVDGVLLTGSLDTTLYADGTQLSIQAFAEDNNDNTGESVVISIYVDNTAPTLTQSHGYGDWISGTTTITFTPSDTLSQIDPLTTMLIIDGTSYPQSTDYTFTTAHADGHHSVEFTAYDNAGNMVHRLFLIEVDNNAPSITSKSHADNQVISGVTTIWFTATSTDFYEIRINGAVTYSSEKIWVTGADGNYIIEFQARDGHYADDMETITLRVNNIAPVVSASATYDNSFATWASGNMYISATASDGNGISNVMFWVDGSIMCADATAPYSCTVNLNSLSDGSHTVDVRAYDGAGATTTITFYINSDKTGPTGYVYLFGNPTNYAAGTTRDFHSSSTVDAGVGLSYVTFYIDGASPRNDGSIPYRYEDLNTYAYSDGLHTIEMYMYDFLGNLYIDELDFVIDNDNPWASISGITNGAYYTRYTTVTVSVTAYDTGTGVNRIEIYVNGHMNKQSYSTSTSYGYVMPSSGSITVLVKIYDNAGHMRSYTYTLYVQSGGGGGGGGP